MSNRIMARSAIVACLVGALFGLTSQVAQAADGVTKTTVTAPCFTGSLPNITNTNTWNNTTGDEADLVAVDFKTDRRLHASGTSVAHGVIFYQPSPGATFVRGSDLNLSYLGTSSGHYEYATAGTSTLPSQQISAAYFKVYDEYGTTDYSCTTNTQTEPD